LPGLRSRNLSALVKHEPMFDERLYVVRCADCGWAAAGEGRLAVSADPPFKADLGAATATGFLFVADPIDESVVRGTLNVLGLEDVSFEGRVDDPPFQVTVLGVTVVIKFKITSRAFMGLTEQGEPSGSISRRSGMIPAKRKTNKPRSQST
jgi:hypothetical protein